MKKMKKLHMLGLGALLALATVGEVKAEDTIVPPSGTVELMASQDDVSVDAKVSMAQGKFGLFARTIADVGYDGSTSDFGLVDATYNIGSGDLVLEGQYSIGDKWFSPRVGIQGYTDLGPVSLYGLATMEMGDMESPTLFEVLGTASYSHDLGEVDLKLGVELLVDAGLEGISYAHQKPRIGIGTDHLEAGIGADIIEIPTEDRTLVDADFGLYLIGRY